MNNRTKRVIVVLVIAIAAASAAAYGMYRAISNIPVRTVEVASTYEVVASKSMPMGTRLTADSVKLVAWPARAPLANGFTDVDAVVGRGLISAVVENEPLTESKLAPKDAGAGLPPSIPEGMRALSVKVDEVIGVAGFVTPGTRVDVLVTVRQNNDSITRTVVSNIQVLTAGTRYDQEKAKDGQPIPTTVVTLLVSPADAEKITLSQAEGQIMLALRNPLDTAPTETRGIRTAGLLSDAAPAPTPPPVRRVSTAVRTAPAPPPPPPPPPVYTVEAIRGAERTKETVAR
jgi:pilus assembly protein CpaB